MCKTKWICWGLCLSAVLGLSFSGLAQTLVVKSERSVVGSLVKVAIVLNSAPQGLERYQISLSAANAKNIAFESVNFPGPWVRQGSWSTDFRGDKIVIASQDIDNAYRAGDTNILLAEVYVRGTARGTTGIQISAEELLDDHQTAFRVATPPATLDVVGGPEPSQAGLVGGNDGLPVDALSATPIILTQAPRGLASYRVTVTLAEGRMADIEGVDFAAFGGNSEFEITSDRDSVSFSAQDLQNEIQPGDAGIVLARVRIRARLSGITPLIVTANRLEDDSGGSVSPSVENGIMSIGDQVDVPPEFSDFNPRGFANLSDTQPALSADVRDIGSGLEPNSIRLEVSDQQGSHSFSLGDPGVSWDGQVFRVNLSQAGVFLTAGRVEANVSARDHGGHFGFGIWQFWVAGPGGSVPPSGSSIAKALDVNRNGVLDDPEIRTAITLWITSTPVPGTGQLISDAEIKRLIQLWVTGGSV